MKKILVADDLPDVRALVIMMIECEFDVQIIEAADGQEAINILNQHSDIDVIVSDYDMPNKTGGDVYQYNLLNNNKPFMLISSLEKIPDEKFLGFSEKKDNFKITKPFEHDKFTEMLASAIKFANENTGKSEDQKSVPFLQSQISGYFRIRGSKLSNQTTFIADTYIKITDGKFVKIGEKDKAIEIDQIQRYLSKNIDYFYLDKEQFNNFLNSSLKNLISKLNSVNPDSSEIHSLHLETIQQVQEVAKSIGVKEPVIEVTDKVAAIINSTLAKEKSLNKVLKNIVQKENYYFEHSNIINYLCGAMVKELGWDTQRATKKFVTVSMFFDIALNDPKFAYIKSLNDSAFSQLSSKEKDEFLLHIKYSIDILASSKNVTGEEFKILEQHHEKPTGAGFPRGLTAIQIPPQSAVFILAHDFAHLLIQHGGPDKISNEQIFEKLGPEYSEGNFEKPYFALKKALSKE
jgi:response regulator RpfG family c-di-GMP phosphodiesterase